MRYTSREANFARPMCCSTVTPGKLATFWRRPVNRLKRVDFPEFGGPTNATVWREAGLAGGGGNDDPMEQLWQSLICLPLKNQMQRSFPAKRNFCTVHP